MNTNKKTSFRFGRLLIITLLSLIVIVVAIVLFFRLETEPPQIQITPTLDIIGAETDLVITVKDQESGIKRIWVAILKDQKETVLFDETLSPAFFFQRKWHPY